MKAQLFLAVVLVILRVGALEGAAQGTFTFNNSSTTTLTNRYGQSLPTGAGYQVAMFFSTDLSALTNSSLPMVLNTNAVTTILPVAGRFSGGTRAVPGVPPGGFVVAQIRAWYGQYPSSEIVFEKPNCNKCCDSASTDVGQSIRFLLGPLGFPPGGTNPIPTLVGAGFKGFVIVPASTGPLPLNCFGPPPLWTIAVVPGAYPYRVRASGKPMDNLALLVLSSSTNLSSNFSSWRGRLHIFPGTSSWSLEWTDPEGTNVTMFYRITSVY